MPQGLQGRQLHLAVFAIVLGITLSVIDTTAVTLGLPAMARDLGVSPDSAIWIVNGFQIAALVALLPLANLGERITYRRVYLAGAALWGAASWVASVADSMTVLVVARIAQGLGAAGLMAVNAALVRITWPLPLLGRGVALNSAVVSVATVLGPVIAAAILSAGSWRWLFAMNVPASLLLLAIGHRALPVNPKATDAPPPSLADLLLNTGLFVLLFMAVDRFGQSFRAEGGQARSLAQGAALLALGGLVAVVHVRRQWHRPRALLPVDLLRIPVFRLSMMTSVGSFAAQTITYIVLPFLLLEQWQATASQAGLLMAYWPVGTIFAAALAGRLIGKYHGGSLGAVGLGCLSAGLASLAWLALAGSQSTAVAWSLGLCGIGFGLFQSPNNHIIITSAPVQRSGAASGMLGSARLTGQTLGAALVAVIFAVQGTTTPRGFSAALAVAAVLAALAAISSTMRLKHQPGHRT